MTLRLSESNCVVFLLATFFTLSINHYFVMIDISDPLNDPDWKGPLLEGSKHYLDEVNATGLDANNVYEKAKAASSACVV